LESLGADEVVFGILVVEAAIVAHAGDDVHHRSGLVSRCVPDPIGDEEGLDFLALFGSLELHHDMTTMLVPEVDRGQPHGDEHDLFLCADGMSMGAATREGVVERIHDGIESR